MADDDLYDPYEKKPSSAGKAPALRDPADRDDPDRPVRTEDLIPRHGSHGTPKIHRPDDDPYGPGMEYYGRPSGWGADLDDQEMIAEWRTAKVAEGLLDMGDQSRTLRGERSMLGPRDENKAAHKLLHEKAKNLVFSADREGTLKHAMTEKYDLGLPFIADEAYEYVIDEWVRLTRYMPNVQTASGQPGVEVFVAMDQQRLDQYGKPMFTPDKRPIMIRTAGTFDRLKEHTPCEICGKRNRIVDLKTSSAKSFPYAQRKSGIQLAQYGLAKEYIPWADGTGATRYDLPDVCLHTGILVSIPPDAPGRLFYVDLVRGAHRALYLVPEQKDHQKEQDWLREFTPVPNVWLLIDRAQTQAEVAALQQQYPAENWAGPIGAHAVERVRIINQGVIA